MFNCSANQNYGNPLLNPLRTVGSWAKLKSSSGSLLCSSLKSAITWLGGNTCAGKVTFCFRLELSRVMFYCITSWEKCHTSLHHHFLVNIWNIFCFFPNEWNLILNPSSQINRSGEVTQFGSWLELRKWRLIQSAFVMVKSFKSMKLMKPFLPGDSKKGSDFHPPKKVTSRIARLFILVSWIWWLAWSRIPLPQTAKLPHHWSKPTSEHH